MDLSRLQSVYVHEGPVATVYLEGRSPAEDSGEQLRKRWEDLRDRLSAEGASCVRSRKRKAPAAPNRGPNSCTRAWHTSGLYGELTKLPRPQKGERWRRCFWSTTLPRTVKPR